MWLKIIRDALFTGVRHKAHEKSPVSTFAADKNVLCNISHESFSFRFAS